MRVTGTGGPQHRYVRRSDAKVDLNFGQLYKAQGVPDAPHAQHVAYFHPS